MENREKLDLTREETREAVWGDLVGYKLISDNIVGHSRWFIHQYIVLQRESDGRFFGGTFQKAATECQEHEYNIDFKEVFPVEKTITVYE